MSNLALDCGARTPPAAGEISAQGCVGYGGKQGRFDQVVGQGWFILCANTDTKTLLSDPQIELFKNLDGRILSVGPAGAGFDIDDIEGFYKNWMAELAVQYVIIRPDFYVAASAQTSAQLHRCFDYLMAALHDPAD